MKKNLNPLFQKSSIIRLILFLTILHGSITSHTQTIGIVQGLVTVSPRQGPPFNGMPTVEFPVEFTPPGEMYVNRFYKFDNTGKLIDIVAVPKGYDTANHGWYGYCVNCTVGDLPQIYRAVTLNCNPGTVSPWYPDPYSDPTIAVQSNPCTASDAWTNPSTWYDYKVPTQSTGAFYINRNVKLNVDFVVDNKAIYCSNNSALTINNAVAFTLINSGGNFINNGVMNAVGHYGNLVNNGVLAPGVNGIGQVVGGQYSQNASGTLNIQIASPSSFDRLYWTDGTNVLGGTLKVSLLNGFVPAANNSFDVVGMSYATYTGTFSNLDLPALPTGLKWKINYNSNSVILKVVDCGSFSGTYVKSDTGCFGSAVGSILATPVNGSGPYLYRLNSGAYGSTNPINNLRAGSYKVSIMDNNGCITVSPTITISQYDAVTGTATATVAACYGTATGSITVTPTTGTAPFTYRLGTTGSYGSSSIFNNLKKATYTVYILDAHGCTGKVTAIVGQPAAITGTFTKTDVTGCFGGSNGSLSVTPTTGIAPYQYKLNSTGTYGISNTFNSLKASTYKVYIKDANGCEGYITVAITQPTPVKATATKTDETCPLARNGTATVTGANGVSPYQYRFGLGGTYGTSNTFSNLAKGSYRIYVIDNNGCGGISVVVTIVDINTTCLMAKEGTGKAMEKALSSDNKPSLSIFPNPSKGAFTLRLNGQKTGKAEVAVTSESGVLIENRSLKTTTTNQLLQFNFANKSNGVYFIKVVSDQGVLTGKVVKD